jgi:hypothetical protein
MTVGAVTLAVDAHGQLRRLPLKKARLSINPTRMPDPSPPCSVPADQPRLNDFGPRSGHSGLTIPTSIRDYRRIATREGIRDHEMTLIGRG